MSNASDRSRRRIGASKPVLSDSRPLGDDRPSPRPGLRPLRCLTRCGPPSRPLTAGSATAILLYVGSGQPISVERIRASPFGVHRWHCRVEKRLGSGKGHCQCPMSSCIGVGAGAAAVLEAPHLPLREASSISLNVLCGGELAEPHRRVRELDARA